MEWVRGNPIKGKVIRLDQSKAIRAAIKVGLKKIKAVLPITPRWIRVIEVDRNKVTMAHRVAKKVGLRKVKIVLPRARVNPQWTVRWQRILDHTRWPPKENRTGENPKAEENRKTRLPILHNRKILQCNLHLL
jgi:hypothetical protein